MLVNISHANDARPCLFLHRVHRIVVLPFEESNSRSPDSIAKRAHKYPSGRQRPPIFCPAFIPNLTPPAPSPLADSLFLLNSPLFNGLHFKTFKLAPPPFYELESCKKINVSATTLRSFTALGDFVFAAARENRETAMVKRGGCEEIVRGSEQRIRMYHASNGKCRLNVPVNVILQRRINIMM